jgi:hypothetical protein
MVTILNELEALPQGHALYVHHKKMPQYLLPELEERRFKTIAVRLRVKTITFAGKNGIPE